MAFSKQSTCREFGVDHQVPRIRAVISHKMGLYPRCADFAIPPPLSHAFSSAPETPKTFQEQSLRRGGI